ncbi:MAG: MATE family efflux transporter [Desulfobacteraceae bacterium]|nr:MATE family efflux transporter [Desulfobacteraceae bacterium]
MMQNNYLESKPAVQFFSYAIPAIVGMLLTSGMVIIDGLFIGNIIGETGLASVNLTLPVLYLFLGIAIMTGAGGAVKAGHALGAQKPDQANRHFSSTIGLAVTGVVLLTVLCLVFLEPLLDMLNTGEMLRRPVESYLGTILWFYPAMMMNIVFSIFLRAQGNPGLSLLFGVTGNLLNLVLDYLMIPRWRLPGAALASGISVMIPMGCGIAYFLSGRSVLRFVKFPWDFREMGQILFNGSSEMIGQLSIGVTTWIFNITILSRMGIDGVAAYTIVGYTAFVQFMIVTGFASGLAPIVGYSYGAGKTGHIKRIMTIALASGFISGVICWAAILFSSETIAALFAPENGNIMRLASSGFSLFASGFMLNGFNILITAYFTSIGNAGVSALIASLRGLLLINLFVLILPGFLGDAGIWLSFPLAELATLIFAVLFLIKTGLPENAQN